VSGLEAKGLFGGFCAFHCNSALPGREAQLVQLYYVEELNLEEIGHVLGVGAARVCQIKASAHARLKKVLAKAV
jgi:RNA polymerase sigma factor for flagellar operon FliA